MTDSSPPDDPFAFVPDPGDDPLAWLTTALEADKSSALGDAVLDMLGEIYERGPAWLKARDVLKNHGVFGPVEKELKRRNRAEMVAALEKKRRARVNEGANFHVSSVWIYDSDPPTYEMEINLNGQSYQATFSDDEISTARKFKQAFRQKLKRQPRGLPTKTDEWDEILSGWLDGAHADGKVVAMPEEASVAGQLRDLIREVVWDRAVGDTIEDFEAGRLVVHPTAGSPRYTVKGSKLRADVAKKHRERGGARIPSELLARLLQGLGFNLEDRVRLGERQVRVYSFDWGLGAPAPPPEPGALLKVSTVRGNGELLLDLSGRREGPPS